MENAATMGTLLHEMGLVLQGLIDSGYSEQFERIIFNTTSDFHINFPENKNFFALFVEDGILKYFPFDDQEDAEKALACFKRTVIPPNIALYHVSLLKCLAENTNIINTKRRWLTLMLMQKKPARNNKKSSISFSLLHKRILGDSGRN